MPSDLVIGLVDRYGPQILILLGGGWIVYKAVMVGLRFFDRVSDTNARHTQTQDTLGKETMDLALKLVQSNEDHQKRNAQLQDIMLEEQKNDRETMRRMTDELTRVSLAISKAVNQMEALTARQADWSVRVVDWDIRLGLFMEHQKTQDTVQSQMFAHIKTIISLINQLISQLVPKDMSPKDQTKEKDPAP